MSLRALKKLQATDEININNVLIEDDSPDEEEDKSGNKFALLLSGEIPESNKEVEVDEDLDTSEKDTLPILVPKKKNKRRRNRNKPQDKAKEDSIEKSLKEINAVLGDAKEKKDFPEAKILQESVLKVSRYHLNSANELKRIFGAKVVSETRKNKRENRCEKYRMHIVNNVDIPMGKSGISMDIKERHKECTYFKFVHDRSYQKVQENFQNIVKSHDHERVVNMLRENPYHIDLLLQVSEIFTMTEDAPAAVKLIEKAIFIMQQAFHPQFNYSTDYCRLDYRQRENRSFFIAVFRHILNVGNKGCPRTALELCKLLLGLSPLDDPLAITLMIDYYALKAKEYAWFISFYDEFNGQKKLSLLPNIAYSVSMAWFLLSKQPTTIQKLKLNKEHSDTQEFMKGQADLMLQKALITFPHLLIPLLDKINVKPEDDVENHEHFSSKNANVSNKSGLRTLIDMFISRNYQLWRDPEVISWLIENVHKLLNDKALKEVFDQSKQSEENYPGLPAPIFRHIFLSHLDGVTIPRLPQEYSEIVSYDPIPPIDSVCDYKINSRTRPNSARGGLQEMFYSFLPFYDLDVDEEARDRAEIDLRQLLNSMRDMILTMRPAEDDRSPEQRFPEVD